MEMNMQERYGKDLEEDCRKGGYMKKLKLIILQLLTECLINPIYFKVKSWYERSLEEYTK